MALVAGTARLLEIDPDLADGMAPELAEQLRRHLSVNVLDLPSGAVELAEVAAALGPARTGFVVSGLLVRETRLAEAAATAIYGPGDVLRLGSLLDALVPARATWIVAAPTTVVPLDNALISKFSTWPGLASRLLVRAAEQARRDVVLRAISQLPQIQARILGLLWHLAERWGQVSADGIVVPISLTHEMMGRLVGSRRPTVSLALKELAAEGHVERRADGAWLLDRGGLATLVVPRGAIHAAMAAPERLGPEDAKADLAPTRIGDLEEDERQALLAEVIRLKADVLSAEADVASAEADAAAVREQLDELLEWSRDALVWAGREQAPADDRESVPER